MYIDWINEIVKSVPVVGPPDLDRQPNTDDIILK